MAGRKKLLHEARKELRQSGINNLLQVGRKKVLHAGRKELLQADSW